MKNILLMLMFVSASLFSYSQSVVIKPAVGINFSDFSKSPATGKYSSQVGWQIGGSIAFGERFYVEPGIFYAQKSSEYSAGSSTSDVKFDISGIRIPVGIGFKLLGEEKSPFNIRVMGGGSAFIVTSVSEGDKSEYSSPTWGVYAGAGVDFLMLFVDLKYEWSLTNVQKDISQVDIGKSRSFFINAGVRLPLGD